MLAALGLFVFDMHTAPLSEESRNSEYRYARPNVLGARAASQYLGPGADTITLSGRISHDVAGKELSLDALRAMAGTGKSWPYIKGTGQVIGDFEIDNVSETGRYHFPNGKPRLIEFTVTITRVENQVADVLALVTSPLSLLS